MNTRTQNIAARVTRRVNLEWLLASLLIVPLSAVEAVDLVDNGQPVAEIVLPDASTPSAKVAAQELQRHLESMSGARLPIVSQATTNAANHVYVGDSAATRALGVTLDDVKDDGFKIVATQNVVVLAGRDLHHFARCFGRFRDVPRGERQKAWEAYVGHKWRFPPMIDYRDFNDELGFHLWDGTGTLYAMFELLEQLGMRFYMPVDDIGTVVPKVATLRVREQSIKREPAFAQRIMTDGASGDFRGECLWYKSLRVGTGFLMPIYHSLSGPLKLYHEEQPQEYYGKVGGAVNYFVPRLTNERLRRDVVEYLNWVDRAFPGIDYMCIGQPDGWMNLDSDDAAAGWDKMSERGRNGRFSDYAWAFNLEIRRRLMETHPDKKFTVFAYGATRRPPTTVDKVPTNMAVVFCQTSQNWMEPQTEERDRAEWLPKLSRPDQLLIWEYYLSHAPRYQFPPVPIIFTELMNRNFKGLYDRCAGFLVEVAWTTPQETERFKRTTGRPGLTHLMLYLHGRLTWDRDLDVAAVVDEYCRLFYGPAAAEMKEFLRFAESVWMRPESRLITSAGGFLKPADVDRYFEILGRARAKAGDSVYGRRVDYLAAEMAPLKTFFASLRRTGPMVTGTIAAEAPVIDGDLEKPFWRAPDVEFLPLRDMKTNAAPATARARTAFRWLADNSALIVGIECMEPNMAGLRTNCRDADSMSIFDDDMVEVRLETAGGSRPFIVVNPAGTVYDECVTERLEDLPTFYAVSKVAVKKLPDRWTVELRIDAAPLKGERPTAERPWGIHVNRQRMAGGRPELTMLSPSGTNFKNMKSMASLTIRK